MPAYRGIWLQLIAWNQETLFAQGNRAAGEGCLYGRTAGFSSADMQIKGWFGQLRSSLLRVMRQWLKQMARRNLSFVSYSAIMSGVKPNSLQIAFNSFAGSIPRDRMNR